MKISHIKNAMEELGIGLSLDQIRKLEKAGIVKPSYTKSGQRTFNDKEFAETVKALLLYYFNTPIKDIVENKPSVIAKRIKAIKKALRMLK